MSGFLFAEHTDLGMDSDGLYVSLVRWQRIGDVKPTEKTVRVDIPIAATDPCRCRMQRVAEAVGDDVVEASLAHRMR